MMKTLVKLCFVFACIIGFTNILNAQTTRKERQAIKQAAISKMVMDTSYIFEANYATPLTGGQRNLTSDYDFKVTKDTITAFLPYFGRAYLAPSNPTTNEGGIKFTSTNYSYSLKQRKNGNWVIIIKPKDTNISDWRDVQSLTLDISADGYASLQVISTNRDAISFNGEIVGIEKKKS
jgi:hypothetical protein